MGYYTDFTLRVYGRKNDDTGKIEYIEPSEFVMRQIEAEIENMNLFEAWGDEWYCNAKWYDNEDDMLLLSKKFPEVLFQLCGNGEETEDLWEQYFYNGMSQFCPAIITYDDFDINKLTKPKQYVEKYSYQ